jgi:hypothetical protein
VAATTGATGSAAQPLTLTTSDFGKFYNITTSGLSTVFVPATASLTPFDGSFWVLRNNTSSYLSLSVYYVSTTSTPNGISVPFVIAPSNSAVMMWSASPGSFIIY